MQVNRRFFIALLSGLGMTFLIFFILIHGIIGIPTLNSRWLFEIYKIKREAALSVRSPKLLIISGSSGLFGISAREIYEQTGHPAINFSTHADLGAEYLLYKAQEALKPGDTVLLAFEYELYDWDKRFSSWMPPFYMEYLLSQDPDYFQSFPVFEKYNMIMTISAEHLKKRWGDRFFPQKVDSSAIYNDKNINRFGDQIHHDEKNRPLETPQRLLVSDQLAHGLSDHPSGFAPIKKFCDWAGENHIRVLATFPNINHRKEYDQPSSKQAPRAIQKFYSSLGVPVLGDYKDSILTTDDFFDTHYHLTQEASIIRTRRLLVHLAPILKETY